MEKQPTDRDISTASDRFLLASNKHEDYHDGIYALFQPKILSAIAALKLKHKRPVINSNYEHLKMTEASNAGKEFIEGEILQMIKDGRYDSFYRKLSSDNDNINPSQRPSATNTPFRFLNDTFTPPQDNIQTPVIDKISKSVDTTLNNLKQNDNRNTDMLENIFCF